MQLTNGVHHRWASLSVKKRKNHYQPIKYRDVDLHEKQQVLFHDRPGTQWATFLAWSTKSTSFKIFCQHDEVVKLSSYVDLDNWGVS